MINSDDVNSKSGLTIFYLMEVNAQLLAQKSYLAGRLPQSDYESVLAVPLKTYENFLLVYNKEEEKKIKEHISRADSDSLASLDALITEYNDLPIEDKKSSLNEYLQQMKNIISP